MNTLPGTETLERTRARNTREDSAPRLARAIPDLISLSLAVKVMNAEAVELEGFPRVLVDVAPALFVVPCRSCRDGEYDVTGEILRALEAGRAHFYGSLRCSGITAAGRCPLVLYYSCIATYGRQVGLLEPGEPRSRLDRSASRGRGSCR